MLNNTTKPLADSNTTTDVFRDAYDTPQHSLRAVFWDMDGTLIDSEPYWHDSEIRLAQDNGGEWNESLAWEYSGSSLADVAQAMIAHGTQLSVQEIADGMVDYVAQCEQRRVPWVPGVFDTLRLLKHAGIPSILVSNSPRRLVDNVVAHAPEGAFIGYICGDDGYATKPSPEPYLAAGSMVGIRGNDDDFALEMAHCIAFEDSTAGLASAVASGATTVAQCAFSNANVSGGAHFASIDGYDMVTVPYLEDLIRRRIARDFPENRNR